MSAYYQHKARVLFPRRNLPAQPQKRDYPANADYVRALSKWADEEAEAQQHNSDVMAKRAHFLKEKLHAKEKTTKKVLFGKAQKSANQPGKQTTAENTLGHPKKWKMLTPDSKVFFNTILNIVLKWYF
jgi:hypothetical protein